MNISLISNRFRAKKDAIATPEEDHRGRVLISRNHQARATPETIEDIKAVASASIRNLRGCQPLISFGSRANRFPTDPSGLDDFLREHFAIMLGQDPFASLFYQSDGKRERKYFEPEFIWLVLSSVGHYRGTLDPYLSHLAATWESKAIDDLSCLFGELFSGHAHPLVAGKAAFRKIWQGWSAYFSPDSRPKVNSRKKRSDAGMKRLREGEEDEVPEVVGRGTIPHIPDDALIPRC